MNRTLKLTLALAAFASALPAGAGGFIIERNGGGIADRDVQTILSADGKTATIWVEVPKIPEAATGHNPHCSEGRWNVAGIRLGGGNRDSECIRFVLIPPNGYETNASVRPTAALSHAWGMGFGTDWLGQRQLSAVSLKNWSADGPLKAILTISVCPTGSGCTNLTPPPAPTPAPAPPAPERVYREKPICPPRQCN